MSASETPLNGRQFRQALAILDREQPSPPEQWQFLWLNRAVWGVLFFSVAWAVALFWGAESQKLQIVPLLLALFSCAAVVILFVRNLRLLRKFWRAARTERRLGITKYVSALTAKVTSRTGWRARWSDAALFGLLPLGIVLAPLGVLALIGELSEFPPAVTRLPLPFATLTFGLACLSLAPMRRFKRRLDAVAGLRQTLLERRARDQPFPEDSYGDLLTAIERTRILVARDQGAAARRAARGPTGGVRLARPVQESLSLLDPDEIARVYAALRLLLDRLRGDRQTSAATAEGGSFAVPDTSLAIAFTRDSTSGEVLVNALYRSGRPLERADDDALREGRQE